MKPLLVWHEGRGVIAAADPLPAPRRGEVLLELSRTLCMPGSPAVPVAAAGRVLSGGTQTDLGRDTPVVFSCHQIASHVLLPESSCFVSTLPEEIALYVPPVADVLLGLDEAAPDLGWNAVVTSNDELAQLVAQVLAEAGARSVSCLCADTETLPEGATHGFTSLSGNDDGSLAHRIAQLRGPVVLLDTSARASVLQNILDVMPPHGVLLLAGHAPGDVTAINFYVDVHKKNIRILGASGGLDLQRGTRAERLLQRRLQPRRLPVLPGTPGETTSAPAGGFVVSWMPSALS